MNYTFAQLSEIRDRVVRELAQNQTQLTTARGEFTRIKNSLNSMGSAYTDWATQVDAAAVAFPANTAVSQLKAQKDLLVAEFTTGVTLATSLEIAVIAV